MQKMNKFFKNMSLTGKITLMYGITFGVICVVTSIFMLVNAYFFYIALSKKELAEIAKSVTAVIEEGTIPTSEELRKFRSNNYVDISILQISGNPTMLSSTFSNFFEIENPRQPTRKKPQPIQRVDTIENFNDRFVFYQERVSFNGVTYSVQVMRKYSHERQFLSLLAMIFIVANMFGILCTVLIGRYVNRRLLKPVVTISQTAERISIEGLTKRLQIDGPDDEIRKLKVTFNDMLERLEKSFVKQNQFISDASHELRTPISVIQGYANLIDRWGKDNPEVLQESINSIKSETDRMTGLVKKLLFLARGEQNKTKIQLSQVSLKFVAEEIKRELEVMETNVLVTIEADSDANVLCDYDLIKQMLWIFIENSLKYTKQEMPTLTLKVFEENNASVISVCDNGMGIAQEDIPQIFERFYRADKSRSSEIAGTGLGLSIAEWIIKQHNAKVFVKSELGFGTEITVVFKQEEIE